LSRVRVRIDTAIINSAHLAQRDQCVDENVVGGFMYIRVIVAVFVVFVFTALSKAQTLDELRVNATQILTDSCARCHQNDLLEGRERAAKNFGNILDLEALVQEKRYIKPGNPDNSLLWKLVMDDTMPYDVFNGDVLQHAPSVEDKQILSAWIVAEGGAQQELLATRQHISDDSVLGAIATDLQSLLPHRVSRTRYITLAHLYNGGTSDEAMEVYRQAVFKLLNSLTFSADPVRYEKLGPEDTVLRINLDDLEWDDRTWEKLQEANPYAIRYDNSIARFIESETATDHPILRGDFLVFAASQPPLYYELLNLPASMGELERMLGVDMAGNIENGRVARAGFQDSGVSQNNRLIERHSSKFGAFWNSYDFAGNKDRQSLFLFPLGPGGDAGFKHDGGEVIFNLPNGMQAYFLATADGARLDSGPTEIVRDQSRADFKVTNGISCMSCHAMGIREDHQDTIREYVLSSAKASKHQRDAVSALYPTPEQMGEIMARDKQRFLSAMRAAGLDPNLNLNQTEMTLALFDQFEQDLSLEMAAAEFGLSVEQFENHLPRAGREGFDLGRRLKQDRVPRDQFTGLFAELAGQLTDNRPATHVEEIAPVVSVASSGDNHPVATFDLALFADRDTYQLNDKPVFTIKSDADCSLTMINTDSHGNSNVLLPNRFRPGPISLKAHTRFQFPSEEDDFQFRLAERGQEKVIALCSTTHERIPGISYDFTGDDFAAQGSEADMNRALASATRQIIVELAKAKDEPAHVGSGTDNFKLMRKAVLLDVR
jgi:hypothetical protein